MRRNIRSSVDAIMADGRLVDGALERAAREALERHKRAGVSIVVWRDGKTIEIPPGRIRIPPLAGRSAHAARGNRGRVADRANPAKGRTSR